MATEAQKQELTDKVAGLVRERFGGDYGRAFAHYDSDGDGRIDGTISGPEFDAVLNA